MSTDISLPEFDDLADVYWRLGVMQSPTQLQGFLVGWLTVGEVLQPQQWLQMASDYIDAIESPNDQEASHLMALYIATSAQLSDNDMALQLLLPDDATDIGQRVQALGHWCQGFMAGFAAAGKIRQQLQGSQQYSAEVTEALNDMAAISQVSLADDDSTEEDREKYLFEIGEYLRLAAITIYTDCHQHAVAPPAEPLPAAGGDTSVGISPQSLFNKPGHKLH